MYLAFSRPLGYRFGGPDRNYANPPFLPKIKMIIAKTKKIKNKILAISIAEPAIRVNPNSAATIAITKNVAAHRNI